MNGEYARPSEIARQRRSKMRVVEDAQKVWLGRIRSADLTRFDLEVGSSKLPCFEQVANCFGCKYGTLGVMMRSTYEAGSCLLRDMGYSSGVGVA